MNASGSVATGTFYRQQGSGRPVIFVHGLGLNHAMWHPYLEHFSSTYCCVAYDMLGHGRTLAYTPRRGLKDFVDQLHELILHLDLSEVSIVGFSMGALIAGGYAVEHPDFVQSMVLVSGVAPRTDDERANVNKRVKALELGLYEQSAQAAVQRWFTETFRLENSSTMAGIVESLCANDPLSYLNCYRVFASADAEYFDALHFCPHPSLVITGEFDSGSTPAMARALASAIPHASAVIAPGVKHMVPVEAKTFLTKELERFLE